MSRETKRPRITRPTENRDENRRSRTQDFGNREGGERGFRRPNRFDDDRSNREQGYGYIRDLKKEREDEQRGETDGYRGYRDSNRNFGNGDRDGNRFSNRDNDHGNRRSYDRDSRDNNRYSDRGERDGNRFSNRDNGNGNRFSNRDNDNGNRYSHRDNDNGNRFSNRDSDNGNRRSYDRDSRDNNRYSDRGDRRERSPRDREESTDRRDNRFQNRNREDNRDNDRGDRGFRREGDRREGGRREDGFRGDRRDSGRREGNDRGERRNYREGNDRRERFSDRPKRTFSDDAGPKSIYSKKKQIEFKKKNEDQETELRLNRYIAKGGVCSRRDADLLITAGRVKVNGEVVQQVGVKVKRTDTVEVDEQVIVPERKVYLVLNKPKDYVTTVEDPLERKTVMSLIEGACKERVFPIGRLDRQTTGVLLFSNDGDLAKKLTHPKYNQKKIYHVFLDKVAKAGDLEAIKNGIVLEDGFVQADDVMIADDDRTQVGIEIHSGRNRIVRRIFEHLGYQILRLDRVFFAGITKKNLPRGRWRFLTQEEVNVLKAY